MTDGEFYAALIGWVDGITKMPDMKWIQAYQNGPKPALPYGTFNITESETFARDTVIIEPGDGGVDVETCVAARRVYTVSVNLYGLTNPVQVCEQLKASLRTSLNQRDHMDPLKIGFVRASNVRRLPEEINNRWEDRAQFDLVLNVIQVYNDSIESIEEANVEGDLDSGTDIHSVQINVGG